MPKPPPPDVMLYVGGEKVSFHCHCGCNVFRKVKPNVYECNSCDSWYSSASDREMEVTSA